MGDNQVIRNTEDCREGANGYFRERDSEKINNPPEGK